MSVELSFWILIVSGITDFLSCIPESKAQESGIHKQKFPRFPYMYPGYQRFFLACDGELRFVGRRPKRVRPKAEDSLWHPGYLTWGEKYVNSHKVMAPRHSPQSPLFFLSLTPFFMSLRQWKINFQPRIKLNDNIDIHTYLVCCRLS